MSLQIKRVSFSELDAQSLAAVRAAAWHDKYADYAVQVQSWLDEWDAKSDHFIFEEQGDVLAVSRFNMFDVAQDTTQFAHADAILEFCRAQTGPVGIISRLSVHPKARGRGLAKALDQARIAYAKGMALSAVIGEVKTGSHRIAALAALGFETIPGAEAFPSTPFGVRAVEAEPRRRVCCGMFLALD